MKPFCQSAANYTSYGDTPYGSLEIQFSSLSGSKPFQMTITLKYLLREGLGGREEESTPPVKAIIRMQQDK